LDPSLLRGKIVAEPNGMGLDALQAAYCLQKIS